MTPERLHHVSAWLNDLATLTAGNAPLADSKTKIAALASTLADEYPEAAFTKASLVHVARACKFLPSFGEICTALSAWWRENRPAIAAANPDTQERLRVALTPERERLDVSELGITKRLIELERLAAEGTVQAALASLGLRMLRVNVEERAPKRLHMLPDVIKPPATERPRSVREQLDAVGSNSPVPPAAREAFKALHGRYPGELSPDQLRAVRERLATERVAAGLPPTPERH